MDNTSYVLLALLLNAPNLSAHTISTDYCDPKSYTDEVRNLTCDNKGIRFRADGLPHPDHPLMTGITATNQQFPVKHNYEFSITNSPKVSAIKTTPDSGPIGVAVNGIPIFDPATQGPVNPITGKRPSTLDAGELDTCGGHAGRGDDYHYHVAPSCLIKQLGANTIEVEKKPIGFAMDGHPIHALGWFNPANSVEAQLDPCRGMTDQSGTYFYNVKIERSWDILNCFNSEPRKFAKDRFEIRTDRSGAEITGLPLGVGITEYRVTTHGKDMCHLIRGEVKDEQILLTDGSTRSLRREPIHIFYCNSGCYGHFNEADRQPQFRGRVLYYELELGRCPTGFDISVLKTSIAYTGPAQSIKGRQSTKR
jgi:hypothetical protein